MYRKALKRIAYLLAFLSAVFVCVIGIETYKYLKRADNSNSNKYNNSSEQGNSEEGPLSDTDRGDDLLGNEEGLTDESVDPSSSAQKDNLQNSNDDNTSDNGSDDGLSDGRGGGLNSQDNGTNVGNSGQMNEIEDAADAVLAFTGDVLFSDSPLNKYHREKKGVTGILSEYLTDILNSADVAMVNLEFPFSLRGNKMQDKQYTFRADPKYVSLLQDMGVDIVSLANNHTLDYGIDAFLDTLDTLKGAGISASGGGKNLEEAKKLVQFNVYGKKIAILSASRVIPVTDWNAGPEKAGLFTTYDPALLLKEIEKAEEENDITIVYVHWGLEHKEKPESYQRTMAKQYIDAGADLIIGSHPHVLQGIEYYDGKPIVYSLGNFIFGSSISRTALLKVTIDGQNNLLLQLIPCRADDARTYELIDNSKQKEFYNYMESISFGVKIDEKGYIICN